MKASELLLKYRTDKNCGTIDPEKGHSYGNFYDEIFSWFDREKKLNILEIGVQKGGSLKAWRDYFSNASITGIDIEDVREKEYISADIRFILSDIKNVNIKQSFGDPNFDIIIDDGSHLIEDVLFVVKNYLQTLNINGVIIIEDVQLPIKWLILIFLEIIKQKKASFELQYRDVRKTGRYDDFLIIIKGKEDSLINRFVLFIKNICTVAYLLQKEIRTKELQKRIKDKLKKIGNK